MTKPFLFSGTVINCYDSHVHWPATGHWARRLNLQSIRYPDDLKNLKITADHFAGEWLLGNGWDQNLFPQAQFPTAQHLDTFYQDIPVCFTRIDGHAIWVNTLAMKKCGLWQKNIKAPSGGEILLNTEGFPTGIFIDQAIDLIKKFIPPSTSAEVTQDLLAGQKAFHQAGFTHIRDLTCDLTQWQTALKLEAEGLLQMAVEEYFSAYKPEHFNEIFKQCVAAKAQPSQLLRVRGVKVFYDGALGSEGALLSKPYLTSGQKGLRLIEPHQLREMLVACHKNGLRLAVHTIGDQAAHEVAEVAHDLHLQNRLGPFEIEHLELLRPETFLLLKKLPLTVYFQPSHWLSDKRWLKQKIGDLTAHLFRWRDLENNNIPFYFGSDSPIEESSFARTLEALDDSAGHSAELAVGQAVPPLQKSGWHYHAHADVNWPGETQTQFTNGRPTEIIFAGKVVARF